MKYLIWQNPDNFSLIKNLYKNLIKVIRDLGVNFKVMQNLGCEYLPKFLSLPIAFNSMLLLYICTDIYDIVENYFTQCSNIN